MSFLANIKLPHVFCCCIIHCQFTLGWCAFSYKSWRGTNQTQFHHVPGIIYHERFGHNIDLATYELILRNVPDEVILVRFNNKVPGLGLQLDASELNLLYKYNVEELPPGRGWDGNSIELVAADARFDSWG